MEPSYWHEKWENNDIRFHENQPNPLLVKHLQDLVLPTNSRVFLPLCGKTRDIGWLLSQGFDVVGAELSELAVEQLFAELRLTAHVDVGESMKHYSAPNLDIYVGDIFALTPQMLGSVQAVYDRAALVALPEDTRRVYSNHIINLTDASPQLLICFEYDQAQMQGPPFAIFPDEINRHYASSFSVTELERIPVAGGLKGKCEAMEIAWLFLPQAGG